MSPHLVTDSEMYFAYGIFCGFVMGAITGVYFA
mgnify:CR=1 FL=1